MYFKKLPPIRLNMHHKKQTMSQKIKQNVKKNKILQTKSFKTKEKCSGGGGGGVV